MFELQMEAFCNQLVHWNLNSLPERLQAAEKDALSGGVFRRRVPEDTHFLGDAQWDYCRQLAEHANLLSHSNDNAGQHILNYIATNKVGTTFGQVWSRHFFLSLSTIYFYFEIVAISPDIFQAIYDHAGAARKGHLPGSPDSYRSLCYERNDPEQTFRSWSCDETLIQS